MNAHFIKRNNVVPLGIRIILVLLITLSSGVGQEDGSASAFEPFESILENNIFNPNRTPLHPASEGPPLEREPDPEPLPVERFVLLGTLAYNNKEVAFFHGSDSSYRNAFQPGDRIADWRIVKVALEKVVLETKEGEHLRTAHLPVGMEMQRRGEGSWETHGPSHAANRSIAKQRTAKEVPSGSEKPSTGEKSDILKQLMEQRQQEMNQ